MKTFLINAAIVIRGRPKVSAPAQPSGSLGHRNADPARQYPWSALLQLGETMPLRLLNIASLPTTTAHGHSHK
jgi:hypothetical protein